MRKWYLLLSSLVVTFILYIALMLVSSDQSRDHLKLDSPVRVLLKSNDSQPMDFWDVVHSGIKEAAKEFDLEVEISGARYEREIERQVNIFNGLVKENPPIIILAASDYRRLVEPVERAVRQGIPVITVDSGIDSDAPTAFIATDNIEAGQRAGQEMLRLIKQNERKAIAIVSHIRETATAIEREKGVRNALVGVDIIGTWFCDVDEDIAYSITRELLENEALGGIVALNEVATLGVARAVEEGGAVDRVDVVGFDNAIRELNYLEQGVIKATVVQRPYHMGYLAVKTAWEVLRGKKVRSFVDTGSLLITADNMFQREYQELLFPFSEE